MANRIIVTSNIDPKRYNEGDKLSKQYKVVKTADNYLVVGRTFKNGNPKKMSLKFIFAK